MKRLQLTNLVIVSIKKRVLKMLIELLVLHLLLLLSLSKLPVLQTS
jgi:hypothetical protein